MEIKGLGKVKALKMIGMNGMKNVKLEPLIVGMAANGPLVADGLIELADGYGWMDCLKSRADLFERRNGGNTREGMSDRLI